MSIQAIRKGFRYFKMYPKITIFAIIYINASVWIMSCDVSSQSMDRKSILMSANKIFMNSRNANKGDIVGINEQATAQSDSKLKIGGFIKMRGESKLALKRHLIDNVEIEQYKTAPRDVNFGVRRCNMDRYIQVTKPQCHSELGKTPDSQVSNDSARGRKSLTSGYNKSEINRSYVDYARYNGCDIDNVFFDCDELRYSYLYGKDTVTDEEELFPLAFAMKIHKSENQAHRLLRYIYQKHNLYCIHIDLKAPAEIYFKFKQIGKCFDNIIVIEDRIDVVYSSIRQINAEFKCMEAMIMNGHKWKYYINLTGQEFMLRTNLELVRILQFLNGTNDIENYPVPLYEFHKFKQKARLIGKYVLVTKESKPPFPGNVEMRKGSAYGMFSRNFVEFLMTDKFVTKFHNWLTDTYAPEELIWATLNNIPGVPGGNVRTITGEHFLSRAVKWQMDTSAVCGGKFVHWICIYGTKDVKSLLSHRNVVANKFYDDYQPLALDCIENEMYSRQMAGHTSNLFNLNDYRKLLEGSFFRG